MTYRSNIPVSHLIMAVADDIDVFPAIENASYIAWYNDIVQSIYKSIIKPYIIVKTKAHGTVKLSNVFIPGGVSFPEGAQMYLEINGTRRKLLIVDREQDLIFRDSAYIGSDEIKINSNLLDSSPDLVIELLMPPTVVTADNMSDITVPFPIEYHDMIAAKLKGEAFKMCNQDNTAAKYLNDFNASLEDFKAYHYNAKTIV